jgi:hypothetical protein
MRFSRLLIALILLLLGVIVPVAAQGQQSPKASPPAASPFDSSPLLKGQLPPMNPKGLNLYSATPQGTRAFQLPRVLTVRPGTMLAMNDERCYTLRDYRFSRESPGSDATRFLGSSTCEPASQVHLKSAEGFSVPNLHARPSIEHCGFGYGDVCPAYPRGATTQAR